MKTTALPNTAYFSFQSNMTFLRNPRLITGIFIRLSRKFHKKQTLEETNVQYLWLQMIYTFPKTKQTRQPLRHNVEQPLHCDSPTETPCSWDSMGGYVKLYTRILPRG
jgi:hypothetical protein